MSNALEINNLVKTYDNNTEALKGISFRVEDGDFFALLGPNGAGKSTTISIITSLIRKTTGGIKVFGYDLDENVEKVKSFIGVVPQEFNFNIFVSLENILYTQAGYYGIPRKKAKQNVEKYLKQLGLWAKRKHPASSLSGGMKRRLMIARGLVHNPKLLILDEPTAGVDIELRRSMWDFLTNLNQSGKTIILTTHYLEEAENLCRNIAIIDQGKIIRHTKMNLLLRELECEKFIFDLQDPIECLPEIEGFQVKKLDEVSLEVGIPKAKSINDVFELLSSHQIKVLSMRNKSNRLEELFLNLTRKEQ